MPLNVQDARRLLFTPCSTREHFNEWVKTFLHIDLPDTTVSEESSTNPLDAAWTHYRRLVLNDLAGYSRGMVYACRGGFKTLSAAILETMVILHTKRNVAHMAAIEPQAKKSASYIKNFFKEPVLRDFTVGDNARELQVERYVHKKTGAILNLDEFKELDVVSQNLYDRNFNYLKLVICTMAGANCVAPETLITKSDRTLSPAWSIEVGDEILSFDTKTHEWVVNEVQKVDFSIKEALELKFNNGGTVVVSEDHPVFSDSGFRRARTLRKNMGFWFCGNFSSPDSIVSEVEIDPAKDSDPWQIIWGSLLGDSSIQWPKNSAGIKYGVGPRISCFHSHKQSQLLEILSEALKKIGVSSIIIKDKDGFRLQSQPSSVLIDTYNALIIGDKKTITPQFLNRLQPEGLAMWFADDGSGGPEDIGSTKGNSISISTCGFSIEENHLIVDWLKERFKITANVRTVSSQSKKKWPIVKMDKINARLFSSIVWDYVPSCVRYKLLVPHSWLDTFCVETGQHMATQPNRTVGFRRLVKVTKDQRKWRKKWELFSKRFTGRLVSIRPVGRRVMLDLVLNAESTSHNFVANNFLLLHNSEHVEFFIVDEVDVVLKQNVPAYYQAQNIPDPRDGLLPLTLLTSTRKSRVGLVQQEIDQSEKTGLHVNHWNLIDITERCKPDRHRPEEPKQTYYVNDDLVQHIPKEEFEVMNPGQKTKWYSVEGFAGCKSCRLFAACKGRLATHQTSNSSLLKPIEFALEKFQSAPTPEFLNTEYLCRKPDSTGLVYPRLNKEIHMLTAQQMANLIDEEVVEGPVGKAKLIQLLKEKGAKFYAGMDFGFTHLFAVVVVAVFGQYVFVIDCYAQAGLELEDQISNSSYLKEVYNNCPVFADPAYPGSIKSFRTKGFAMKKWDKSPGSVKSGIEIVRSYIWNARSNARLLFLADDDGVALAFRMMERYKLKMDVTGKPTEEPDETDDDIPDALRYVVMNVLGRKEALKDAVADKAVITTNETQSALPTTNNWLKQEINKALGVPADSPVDSGGQVRKGRFFFSG